MPPNDWHFTREALEGLDGKVLPVTIEVDGEKRTVGVAALSVSGGDIRITGEITDPRLAEIMMTKDAPYFSAPEGVNRYPKGPHPLEARWKEGLFDGGD
jgi:hypothetical protein